MSRLKLFFVTLQISASIGFAVLNLAKQYISNQLRLLTSLLSWQLLVRAEQRHVTVPDDRMLHHGRSREGEVTGSGQ